MNFRIVVVTVGKEQLYFACGLTRPKTKQPNYLLCESLTKMRI